MSIRTEDSGLLIIVSGPAGSGKTTLCDRMLAEYSPRIQRVVTSTTRSPRPGEVDKRDYYFFTPEEFARREQAGEFYETATVHGNRYGTLRAEVLSKLDQKIDVLLNIDVQGAASFRKVAAQDEALKGRIATIFIRPPDLETLRSRMTARGQDSADVIESRIGNAGGEIAQYCEYDYCILTSSREADFEAIRSIYIAEKLKVR